MLDLKGEGEDAQAGSTVKERERERTFRCSTVKDAQACSTVNPPNQ